MPTQTGGLSPEVLSAALAGLEAQIHKIDEHIEKVRSLLGTAPKRRGRPPKSDSAVTGASAEAAPKKRRFSAATRARMRAAQQKRWAALKGEPKAPAKAAAKKAAPQKRRLSAAGRKRIIEATKKRWAEYNAKKAAAES